MIGQPHSTPHSVTMATAAQGKSKEKQKSLDNGHAIKNGHSPSNISHRVPIDVVMQILTHYATLSPSCAVNALLISKEFKSTVETGVYSCVSLFSVRAMESFLRLIKTQTNIGRKVKALWIAPGHADSDLITVLAPPTSDPVFEQRQKRVQAIAREILRSCRRLRHLALDGGFVTPQSATGFGTAAKPQTLLCINPHSFLGNFSAPIFRNTLERLEVVDTTLAVEEIDEIRQMNGLRKFFWTNPRAKADVTRDVSILLRILSPNGRDILQSISGDASVSIGIDFIGDTEAATQDLIDQQQERLMHALSINESALPEKARMNDKLKIICTITSQARAAALAATFKKIVENLKYPQSSDLEGKEVHSNTQNTHAGDSGEDDVSQLMKDVKQGTFYVDSSRANSTSIHPLSGVELQTKALTSLLHALQKPNANKSPNAQSQEYEKEEADDDDDDEEVVEEWEALRNLVRQRKLSSNTPLQRYFASMNAGSSNSVWLGGPAANMDRSIGNSGKNSQNASGTQTPSHARAEEEIDGGRALQRIWYRWLDQVGNGELDGDVL